MSRGVGESLGIGHGQTAWVRRVSGVVTRGKARSTGVARVRTKHADL